MRACVPRHEYYTTLNVFSVVYTRIVFTRCRRPNSPTATVNYRRKINIDNVKKRDDNNPRAILLGQWEITHRRSAGFQSTIYLLVPKRPSRTVIIRLSNWVAASVRARGCNGGPASVMGGPVVETRDKKSARQSFSSFPPPPPEFGAGPGCAGRSIGFTRF